MVTEQAAVGGGQNLCLFINHPIRVVKTRRATKAMKRPLVSTAAILLSVLMANLALAATLPPNMRGTWEGSTKIHPGGEIANVRLIINDQQDDFYFSGRCTIGETRYTLTGQLFLFNTILLLGASPTGESIFMAGILDWLPRPTILVFFTVNGLSLDKMYHRFTLTKTTS
jgi:hypothetical protein